MNKEILLSLIVISTVVALVGGATLANFSDTETSSGNTFTAGTLDLKIDLQCEDGTCGFPEKDLGVGDIFFHECDIKPGDSDEVTISWHVYDNDAWGRLRIADVQDWEYGCTEPEREAGDTSCDTPGNDQGELSQYITFTAWMDEGNVEGWQCPDNKPCETDPQEGNNIFDGKYEVMVADNAHVSELIEGIPLPEKLEKCTTYYLGLKWNLPADTGNIVQSDSLTASIIMEVEQSRNNPTPW